MVAKGPFICRVFCALKFIISNVDVRQAARFFMKYMHAIGQHERLSLANGLLQMFSQADKLRTVSRGMPGVKKKEKKKDIRISKLKFECQPTELIFLYSERTYAQRAEYQRQHYYTHI